MQMKPRSLRAWTVALLWAVLVWNLGGDSFSSAQTSRILAPLLQWLFPNGSSALLAELLFYIRKSAHVVEYGILAVLTIRALWSSWAASVRRALAATLALVGGLAIGDELRQSATLSRTGTEWDVLLDVTGALFAIGLMLALPRRWQLQGFSRPDAAA